MRRSVSFSIKLNDTGMPETMEGTTPSIRHCTSQARYSDISERSKRYRTLIMVRALLNLVVMAEDGRLWRRRRRRFGFFRTTPGTPIRGIPVSSTGTSAPVHRTATTIAMRSRLAAADVNFIPHRVRWRNARQYGEGARYDSKHDTTERRFCMIYPNTTLHTVGTHHIYRGKPRPLFSSKIQQQYPRVCS